VKQYFIRKYSYNDEDTMMKKLLSRSTYGVNKNLQENRRISH
jgi:hypothetical protein